MVDVPPPIDIQAKLAEIRAAKAAKAPPAVQQPPGASNHVGEAWDPNVLLPDLGTGLPEHQVELDNLVNSIPFAAAYNKWIGKMTAIKTKVDGNEISCPFPWHRDPPKGDGHGGYNAWFREDNTFYCGKCQRGGDIHDLAAIHYGYDLENYRDKENFPKLRLQMGEAFGYRVKSVPGGTVSWVEPVQTTPPTAPTGLHLVPGPSAPSPQEASQPADPGVPDDEQLVEEAGAPDNVASMWADDEEDAELVIYPTINWQTLIPEDTFIHEYMKAACNDDAPEEYHFWHALMALGLVVGRKVTLDDTQPVYGNLLLCILGATGTGKSRSRRHLNHVLKESAPYHEDGTHTTGVKLVPVPSSGEYLVKEFYYEGKDPTGKIGLGPQRVTGIVDFDEMAALLSRANRQGSTLKPTLMALADATPEVKIGSLMRGDFIAHEPFCSITASTQPKAIRTLLNRADTSSGFLNRWVFAGGKSKEIEIIGGSRSDIRVDLTTAIERLKNVRGWGSLERSIEFDDDAYEAYARFFRNKIEPAKIKDETDLLKRIDLITKKLILLLTINLRKNTVPLQVVQAVEELFDYVLECYGILNSNIGITMMQDVMTEIQRHIIRHQQKTGRGASARDISRYTARKNYSLEQIKKALDVMTALDIIELAPKEQGAGRPAMRYLVVGA